jgi:hypothetical protein
MKATLVKERGYYDLYRIDEDGKKVTFASTEDYKQKLSKQNCDEIFGVVDVEKLAHQSTEEVLPHHGDYRFKNVYEEYFREGFNKAIELNKDKVFTENDILKAIEMYYGKDKIFIEIIKSLQQPTEIEVMIEMKKVVDETKVIGAVKGVKGSGDKITTYKSIPKLDSNGCLILKRVV